MMKIIDKVEGFTINYRKTLGQGAFGCIYECTHPDIQEQICVKIMYDKASEQVQIQREFQIVEEISRENNPYLVKVYKCAKENKQIYIFMEKCQENLEQYIKRMRDQNQLLEVVQILDFACQITRGYATLYKKNIIHRDLKPENILIGYDNKLKIADFGLGKFIDQAQQFVKHTTVGTPLYASPQAILTGDYTSKTDVFSFGALVFYLTFQKPIYTNVSNLQQLIEYAKNHDKRYFTPDIHNKGDLEISYLLAELIQNTLKGKEEDRPDWTLLIQFVNQYQYEEPEEPQLQQSNNSINKQSRNSNQFSQTQNQNNNNNNNYNEVGNYNNSALNQSIQNQNQTLQNQQNYQQLHIKAVNLLVDTIEFQQQPNQNNQVIEQNNPIQQRSQNNQINNSTNFKKQSCKGLSQLLQSQKYNNEKCVQGNTAFQNHESQNQQQTQQQNQVNTNYQSNSQNKPKQLTLSSQYQQIDNSKYLEQQSQTFSVDETQNQQQSQQQNQNYQSNLQNKPKQLTLHSRDYQIDNSKYLDHQSQTFSVDEEENISQQDQSYSCEEIKRSSRIFQKQLSQKVNQQEANQHQITNQSNTYKKETPRPQSNQFQTPQNQTQQQGSSISKFPSFIKSKNLSQKMTDSNNLEPKPVEIIQPTPNNQNDALRIIRCDQSDTTYGNNFQQGKTDQPSIIKFDDGSKIAPRKNQEQASIIKQNQSKITANRQYNNQMNNSDQPSIIKFDQVADQASIIKFDNNSRQNNEDQMDVFKTVRNNDSQPNNQMSIIKVSESQIKPQRNYFQENILESIQEEESEDNKEEIMFQPPQKQNMQRFGTLKKKSEAQNTSYSLKLVVEICIEHFILAEKTLQILKAGSLVQQTSSLYFIMKFVLRLYQNSILSNINSFLAQDEFMTTTQIYQQICDQITLQSLIDYNQNQQKEFIIQKNKLEKITQFSNYHRKAVLEEFREFQHNRENFDIKSILGLLSEDNFLFKYQNFLKEYGRTFYYFLQQRNFNFKNSTEMELRFLVFSLRLIHINYYFPFQKFKSFQPSQITTLVDDYSSWFDYIKSIEPKIILN